jgi:NADH-quinone oxidoreductase subunit G
VLATWTPLLDAGRGQDGEPHLAATAQRSTARLSAVTAAAVGVADGEPLTVRTARGEITLPAQVTPMPDHLVWLPTNARDCRVRETLAATAGDVVALAPGADAVNESGEQA